MIRLENVCKFYKMDCHEVKALNNINLQIGEGLFIVILGNSGSGKSTLLHLIGGLDKPTSGKIFVGEQELQKMTQLEAANYRNKKIGFVFQSFYLEKKYTVFDNVELPLIQKKISREERTKIVVEAIKKVGLSERILHKASQLSGGEQQRVAIARAIVNEPDIILADEPTGNLDSKRGEEIMELLLGLCKQGKTVIVVTHNKEQVKYANVVIEMKDGEVCSIQKQE